MLSKEQVREKLLAGEPVVDIGQIDAETKKALKRWMRDGQVLAGWSNIFPIKKRAWLLATEHPFVNVMDFATDAEIAAIKAKFGKSALTPVSEAA